MCIFIIHKFSQCYQCIHTCYLYIIMLNETGKCICFRNVIKNDFIFKLAKLIYIHKMKSTDKMYNSNKY